MIEGLTKECQPGTDEQTDVVALMHMANALFGPVVLDAGDDGPHKAALIIAALTTYCGSLYGHMIALGVQDETAKSKRAIRAMNERNWNTGVTIGKRQIVKAVDKLGGIQ